MTPLKEEVEYFFFFVSHPLWPSITSLSKTVGFGETAPCFCQEVSRPYRVHPYIFVFEGVIELPVTILIEVMKWTEIKLETTLIDSQDTLIFQTTHQSTVKNLEVDLKCCNSDILRNKGNVCSQHTIVDGGKEITVRTSNKSCWGGHVGRSTSQQLNDLEAWDQALC